MNEQNQFDWVDFYKEFASKLLDYKDRRDELVEKVKAIYTMTGMNMPTLEKDNNLIDIDPFTVFGLFNKKLKDDNRIKILTAIAELFDVKTAVPTSFDSLPVLNPQNATFYYFIGERGKVTLMSCGSCLPPLWLMRRSLLLTVERKLHTILIWPSIKR